jgi:hypothetical protein
VQMTKRLEKARKKAEAVSDAVDVSEKEKLHQIKRSVSVGGGRGVG